MLVHGWKSALAVCCKTVRLQVRCSAFFSKGKMHRLWASPWLLRKQSQWLLREGKLEKWIHYYLLKINLWSGMGYFFPPPGKPNATSRHSELELLSWFTNSLALCPVSVQLCVPSLPPSVPLPWFVQVLIRLKKAACCCDSSEGFQRAAYQWSPRNWQGHWLLPVAGVALSCTAQRLWLQHRFWSSSLK